MSSMVSKKGQKKQDKDNKSSSYKENNRGPCAVVIANLKADNFDPLNQTLPHCMIPLCNVPVLHYLLTRLVSDGFKDIVIYACAHYAELRDFVQQKSFKGSRVIVHNGENAHNLGDVMRDLDASQLLRGISEFLLLPGDLLSTVPLLPILREHEARRSKSPNAILSLVLPSIPSCASRSQAAEWAVTVLFSRSSDNRLLRMVPSIENSSFLLSELTRADPCVELASDHVDLGIAICSVHVPALFQDNFDYKHMDDLVHDLLTNEEVMGYSIHITPLDPGPLILRALPDLLSAINLSPYLLLHLGGSSVFCPPMLLPTTHHYRSYGPQIYISESATVHPKAKLIGACMVAPGCKIDADACLIDCVLGSDCVVGKSARLRRVIAMDSVTFGPRVRADTAWICSRARLLADVRLPHLCFIGPSDESLVTLGPGQVSLPAKSVLVAPSGADLVSSPELGGEHVWASFYSKQSRRQRTRSTVLTGDSHSTQSASSLSDEDMFPTLNPESDVKCTLWDTAEDRLRVAVKKCRRHTARMTSTTSDVCVVSKSHSRRSHLDSVQNVSDEESAGDEGEQSEAFLISELRRTLEHSRDNGADSTANLILEVNSLKHAYNIPIEDLYFLLIKAFFELTLGNRDSKNPSAEDVRGFMTEFKRQLARFHGLFSAYLSSTDTDGRVCLQVFEDTACYRPIVMSASPFVLHALYDSDLVQESGIWWWLDHSPLLLDTELTDQTRALREKLQAFLTWLREAEEEEEEDEDD